MTKTEYPRALESASNVWLLLPVHRAIHSLQYSKNLFAHPNAMKLACFGAAYTSFVAARNVADYITNTDAPSISLKDSHIADRVRCGEWQKEWENSLRTTRSSTRVLCIYIYGQRRVVRMRLLNFPMSVHPTVMVRGRRRYPGYSLRVRYGKMTERWLSSGSLFDWGSFTLRATHRYYTCIYCIYISVKLTF